MAKTGGNFLGSGLAFPTIINSSGTMKMSHYEKSVAESVLIILSTAKGERVMRPDFGCQVNDLVFAPNNASTRSMIEYHIEQALLKWEPRIILSRVEAVSNPDDESRIDIYIEYKNRDINTYFNMVYPFYLERGESDTQSQFG